MIIYVIVSYCNKMMVGFTDRNKLAKAKTKGKVGKKELCSLPLSLSPFLPACCPLIDIKVWARDIIG